MAYRKFTLTDLVQQFGLQQVTGQVFEEEILDIVPSSLIQQLLEIANESVLSTEKAVSEAIVYPILQEIRLRNRATIELFSGENLDADKSKGLNGECDFILAKSPGFKELSSPIFCVVEAKQGEIDKPKSLAQASAQLYGASLFNKKHKNEQAILYGACTSGSEWIFLKLKNHIITIDNRRYSTVNLPQLLGALQQIVNISTQ